MIEVPLSVRGIGNITVYDRNGNIRKKFSHSNTILNSGMAFIFNQAYGLHVGTNTSETVVTQTALNSPSKFINHRITSFVGRREVDKEAGTAYSILTQPVFRIAAADSPYIIAEMGLRSSNSTSHGVLINRIVIKDENGIPTPLQIMQDEFVDVAFEFWIALPDPNNLTTHVIEGLGNKAPAFIECTVIPLSLRTATNAEDWVINPGIAYSCYAGRATTVALVPSSTQWGGGNFAGYIDQLTNIGIETVTTDSSIPGEYRFNFKLHSPVTRTYPNHNIDYILKYGRMPIAFRFNPPLPPKTSADILNFEWSVVFKREEG